MKKQLVAMTLISTILGALAGFAVTYIVLQPQIQSLQQTQGETWHRIFYLNHTLDPMKGYTYETERFQIQGNWIKIEWLEESSDAIVMTIKYSNGTTYATREIPFGYGAMNFDITITNSGEYYLLIDLIYYVGAYNFSEITPKILIAVWDYY